MRISDWSSDVCCSDLVGVDEIDHLRYRCRAEFGDLGNRRRAFHHRGCDAEMLGEFTLDLRPLAEREALVHGIAVGELALAGHQRKQPTQTCHRLRTAFLDDFGKRRAIEWLELIAQHVALTEWQQTLERADRKSGV